MKKLMILFFVFAGFVAIAQEKPKTNIENDTIKTEVVEVVTSYTPKITDAKKIKQKPTIDFSRNAEKKKLDYTINSVPVASDFVPKNVKMRTIKIGRSERIFNNYIALGFGNNTTPYLDAYVHQKTNSDGEFGLKLDGIYSKDPVKNTILNSSYYNFGLEAFYKQHERYFDWLLGFRGSRDNYNWYGLPKNNNYNNQIINDIDEQQTYGNYEIFGQIDFDDPYIESLNSTLGFFHDRHSSNEIYGKINSVFLFPLDDIDRQLDDLKIGVSLDFLNGKFEKSYKNNSFKKHTFLTGALNPFYKFNIDNFGFKLGIKGAFGMDLERKKHKFFVYPDAYVKVGISENVGFYVGALGDVTTNSFKNLVSENPYISPTSDIFQTSMYDFYGGLNGVISQKMNYNVKVSYKIENDKPLFVSHKSKFDGSNQQSLLGYEYGNSFNVVYDDVKTTSLFAELDYELSKNFTIGFNGKYNYYKLNDEKQAWNLPNFKTEFFGKYNVKKWYAGANLYFVGNRKGVSYEGNSTKETDLNPYVDLNLNAGYRISDRFTIFVKGMNLTNSNYQRFMNYNSQGFQVIGGFIWKFGEL